MAGLSTLLSSSFLSGPLSTGYSLLDWLTTGMPDAKSSVAPMIDNTYAFINAVNLFFFFAIILVIGYILVRFRKPAGEKAESDVSHNTTLEITWTVIPMILVVIMFVMGFRGYSYMVAAPSDSFTIHVSAQQWSWSFRYPAGFTSDFDKGEFNEDLTERLVVDETQGLHLPPGVPIRLVMTSSDVLHSFWVAEFRVKQDIVPGKISTVWFLPDVPPGPEPAMYWLQCTEYCGTSHSDMRSTVYVHPTWESFEKWTVKVQSYDDSKTWEEWGEILSRRKGCVQCHANVENAPGSWTGPPWAGLWGKTANEHPVNGDRRYNGPIEYIAMEGDEGEAYLMESMRDPTAKYAAGFKGGMPLKRLSDEEILYLIAYIQSLEKKE